MTLDVLRAENLECTVGDAIHERITRLVEQQLRRRDPRIYARGAHDYRDALEDIVQDFTMEILLDRGQLAYFLDVAATIDDFDALANRQIRRYLAQTRERTIVDNLIERATAILRADEFVTVSGSANSPSFVLTSIEKASVGDRGEALLVAGAVAKESVPRVFSNPDERMPKVYTDTGLSTLLRVFLREAGCEVHKPDLQNLFEVLLTPWLTTVLGLDEAENPLLETLTPGDRVMVEQTATRIAGNWTEEDVVVFRYKLSNTRDELLARRLNVSRPTAAARKQDLFDSLREELQDVDPGLRQPLIHHLAAITDGTEI